MDIPFVLITNFNPEVFLKELLNDIVALDYLRHGCPLLGGLRSSPLFVFFIDSCLGKKLLRSLEFLGIPSWLFDTMCFFLVVMFEIFFIEAQIILLSITLKLCSPALWCLALAFLNIMFSYFCPVAAPLVMCDLLFR